MSLDKDYRYSELLQADDKNGGSKEPSSDSSTDVHVEQDKATGPLLSDRSACESLKLGVCLVITGVPYIGWLCFLMSLIVNIALIVTLALRSTIYNLISSMDTSTSPCENFYKYTCGRWGEDRPSNDDHHSNWLTELTTNLNRQLPEFLATKDSETTPLPVNQARQFYRSCLNTDLIKSLNFAPMMTVLESVVGARPILMPQDEVWSKPEHFRLVEAMAKAKLLLGLDVFTGFSIVALPENSSMNIISIGVPSSETELPNYKDLNASKLTSEIDIKPLNSSDVAELMLMVYSWNRTESIPDQNSNAVDYASSKVQLLHEDLERLKTESDWSRREMSVNDLQDLTGHTYVNNMIDWGDFFRQIFKGMEQVDLDPKDEDRILVTQEEYLVNLSMILNNTDINTLYNYVWWRVAVTVLPYTNMGHSPGMTSNEWETSKKTTLERKNFCSSYTTQLFGFAVSTFFYDSRMLNNTRQKVSVIQKDLLSAFNSLVDEMGWMDGYTKMGVRQKAAAMKFFIGFPDWIMNKEKLEEYYKGIVTDEGTFLANIVSVVKVRLTKNLANFRTLNERTG